MKSKIYFCFFLIVGLFSFSQAQSGWTGIHEAQPAPADVRLVQSDVETTSIRFSLDGFLETAVETPQGREAVISVDEGVQILEKGMPDLAKLVSTIIIPDLAKMEVNVTSTKYEEFSGVKVAPSKGHFTRDIRPEDVPYTYGEAYNKDEFWPGDLATLEEPFIMRDFRGQSVSIFPFQYNPVSQTLRVYTDIVVEVSATGEAGKNTKIRNKDEVVVEPEFGQIYDRFFLNMDAASKSYPLLDGEEGSMLIIAYDDFMEAMEPFVDWKRTTGRNVELVSLDETGGTVSNIEDYVEDYYNNNDDFAYLLLVGDGPQIPAGNASGGDSDNAYTFIEGNDSYNDIFIGRFSAETVAHVETQVQRTVEYEKDIDESDTWLSKGMGVARNEGSGHNGESDDQHMDLIRDTLLNFTYDEVHRHYEYVSGMPDPTAADISNDLNDGVSAINFCNHGSVTGWSVAGYNINDVNNLENAGKLPYLANVACVNGDFVNNFCFAEAWMRATDDDGEPTGTIANMSSTINQPWQPPMCGQDEMASIKTEASIEHGPLIRRTYGGISTNGSMFMIPQYGGSGISTHETWILFGDPSLMVRTEAPTPINATYNPVILLGTDDFDITVDDADGATVAITEYDELEDEVVILGTAVIEDGTATVNFEEPPEEPGELTLAITGFNKETYINEELQVIPPDGPYVIFDDFVIDDAAGNDNGEADFGEEGLLNITMENVGIEEAIDVNATLHTDNEYVTITNDSAAFGDIDEESTATLEGAFSVAFSDSIPDQESVLFTIEATDGEDTWESNFTLHVNAPHLVFEDLWAGDSDKETPINPGELTNLTVSIKNVGHATSLDIETYMETNSTWLTVHTFDGVESPPLAPDATTDVTFEVSTLLSTPPETVVELLLTAVSGEYAFEGVKEVVIGEAPVYSGGDIPTTYNTNPTTSSNAVEPGEMSVTIPEGANITSVSVEYDMTAHGMAWMSEQRSFLRCVSDGGETEPEVYQGEDNTGGTYEYERTDLTIANNVEGGGEIEFELHAFRTWGGSGSNTDFNYVDNNSWKLIVYYELESHDVTFFVKNQLDETLEGASVEVSGIVEETDEEGHAGFDLPEGSFYYSAWADNHLDTHNQQFEVVEGEDNLFEVVLSRVFNAEFHVHDVHGNDVADAVITLEDQTMEPGHYEMDELLPGEYTYTVTAEGHADYQGEFEITDGDVDIDIALAPFYIATFTIVDEYGGEVDDAIIHIEGESHEAGHYEFDELVPDTYSYEVTADHYVDYADSFEISDSDKTIEVTLEADGTDVQLTEDADIQIYPNPASSHLSIESPNEEITHVSMVDMLGQEVYNAEVANAHQHEIRVSGLNTGMYFIRIATSKGMVTYKAQVTR